LSTYIATTTPKLCSTARNHDHHDVYPHYEQVFKTVSPDPSHLKDYQPNPTEVWMTMLPCVPTQLKTRLIDRNRYHDTSNKHFDRSLTTSRSSTEPQRFETHRLRKTLRHKLNTRPSVYTLRQYVSPTTAQPQPQSRQDAQSDAQTTKRT